VSKTDEVLLELAYVADAAGKDEQSLAFFKTSLDEAAKNLPPEHSNVIESQLELADAELARGMVPDARALLDRAMTALAHADVSPLLRADLQFADARAIWRAVPADDASRSRAVALAEEARAGYASHAPPTNLYQRALHRIEAWLASPDVRGLPCLHLKDDSACDPWSFR